MKIDKFNYNKCGFGIIEILLGLAIISGSLFSLIFVSQTSLVTMKKSTENIKAAFLLEETIEVIKILRDSNWQNNINTLTEGTSYYLDFNGSDWQSANNNIFIDSKFERKFIIENVYRDASDDIASSGILDPDTKKLTAYVSWFTGNGTTTKNISTYITNLFNN